MLSSCQLQEKMKCEVKSMVELPEVPSASGIEHIGDTYYAIGDNVPWVFVLDGSFQITSKFSLGTYSADEAGLMTKSAKHDFEAMTNIQWKGVEYLFVFGSGSKKPYRFEGKLIDVTRKVVVQTFSLQEFYEIFREEAKLNPDELNIEAAAAVNGKLYLFNRGKNRVVIVDVDHFMEFITGISESLKLKSYSIDLPRMNDVKAGFSGAVGDDLNERILFTASVENTDDWVQDGEILGSFIGVIEVKNLQQHYVPETTQIKAENGKIDFKAESISIIETKGYSYKCAVVTDNDGRHSELLEIDLSIFE
jgi:hypothetical protein